MRFASTRLFLTGAILAAIWISSISPSQPARAEEFRRLSVAEYRDKMAAGWIGQMVGVGRGAPTEFKWKGEIIPEDKVPDWQPEMVNQFRQDDIYVEMTFLRTLELYGMDCSIRQAGIDFANSGYRLWHANRAGRDNLRAGIAPPDSGHPKFNKHADDIDYQIEADYAGLIAPGMPNVAIKLGEKFGRLMNYGDGLYGGQFVGGMYAEAFFETDPIKLVEAGLECVPAESQFAECICDVMAWHRQSPDDWQETWQLIDDKYQLNHDYRRFSCGGPESAFNIDAKINAAYIVMGLLYGNGDLDQTVVISTRCGQDSDCNPSNSGGVLFATLGMSQLPKRFTSALDPEAVFSHTAYNFPGLVAVCEKLVRQSVQRGGGRIEKDAQGNEVFVIPVEEPQPTALETCWEPGPTADSRFTKDEQDKIVSADQLRQADLDKVLVGWKMSNCGSDMDPGLKAKFGGKRNVFMTHPQSRELGCTLSKKIDVPASKQTSLRIVVAHDPRGDFVLVVKADGKTLLEKPIDAESATDGWSEISVDLSPLAGKSPLVELVNQASDWQFEAAYWAKIDIQSR
jgi:hypothetical protein